VTALRWGARSHEGLVRTENEDSFVAQPLVFAVADGMGGHQAGEVASALAVQTVRDRLGEGVSSLDVVIASVVEANAAIFQAAHRNVGQQGMGTTLTAMAVLASSDGAAPTLALVNVGDSRTYRVRGGKLERVTIDHSYVQELVATGHITEFEARTHPRRNIVTRALGIEPTVRVDSWVLSMVRGDRFVLCSDGLVDEVPDHEIELVASGVADPQAAADELVAMANRHGGRDNVTVLVVDVLEGLELPDEPPLPPPTPSAAASLGDTATVPTVPTAPIVADPMPDDTSAPGTIEPAPTVPLAATATATAATSQLPRLPPPDGSPGVGAGPVLNPGAAASTPTTVLPLAVPARKRRFTVGVFLFLLALAVIITVTVTLIAVSMSNDDEPNAPDDTTLTTDVDATVPATEPITLPPTTLPPPATAPIATTVPTATVAATPTTASGTGTSAAP